MPCQWYVRGDGEGKRRILIGQSVPSTPFGMAFGRLKLSPLEFVHFYVKVPKTAKKFFCSSDLLRKGHVFRGQALYKGPNFFSLTIWG
jgi:hypothetical protein